MRRPLRELNAGTVPGHPAELETARDDQVFPGSRGCRQLSAGRAVCGGTAGSAGRLEEIHVHKGLLLFYFIAQRKASYFLV